MAEKATIARPYARAAFEHARGAGDFAAWSQLLAAGAAVASDERAAELLGNPLVTPAQLVEVIAGIAREQGVRVDEPGRNFLGVLAQNRRLPLLPEIAAQFERLRADVENIVDVEVSTAMPLTDEQRDRLGNALVQRFRRQVRLRETLDESLVGGAVIRAGDLVIDGSLRGRLERMAQQIQQ